MLVLKMNNSQSSTRYSLITEKMQEFCRTVPNIKIIDEKLSHTDIMSLLASIDVYVSLHRSEGLGLGLMESMHLGKPVIATRWSGNLDFMVDDNSCLVGYRLIPIDQASPYHRLCEGVSQQWADPDIEEAVRWMRKLAADRELRRQIGARAQKHIADHIAKADRGEAFEAVKELWEKKSL